MSAEMLVKSLLNCWKCRGNRSSKQYQKGLERDDDFLQKKITADNIENETNATIESLLAFR